MSARPDLDVLGKDKPHGTRSRYVSGCRCEDCRDANRRYALEREEAKRRGQWNGLIDASAARAHLRRLFDAGIGLRTVSDMAGLSRTVLMEIRAGRQTRIRALNAACILAVGTNITLDNTPVPAGGTWQRIRELMFLGLTKTRIAAMLGSQAKAPAVQLEKTFVLARNAQAVERLHKRVVAAAHLTHEIREEMAAFTTRVGEIETVLEGTYERRKEYYRAYNKARRKQA